MKRLELDERLEKRVQISENTAAKVRPFTILAAGDGGETKNWNQDSRGRYRTFSTREAAEKFTRAQFPDAKVFFNYVKR